MAARSFSLTAASSTNVHASCLANRKQSFTNYNGLKAMKICAVPRINLATATLRGRLTTQCIANPDTLEAVQSIVAKQLAVDPGTVKPSSTFTDLGADSLDTVEIVMALEEQFKITMEEEGAEKIVTVQDAADLVQEVISSPK